MPEEQEEQNKARKAIEKRIRAMQVEQQKRGIAQKFMEPDAYERLMNVRVANYQLYSQLVDLIIAMVQQNRIQGKMTDVQLRDLLSRLTYRPDSKIEFKHK
ncbi:MAG: hypothetical protein KGI00_01120 [Candidatus Micrarchaeota archaeon]|nr:hypothetical protein [Candidatus Micrarchaeota archaeon]MDE1823895.1 hypothetical protein [Candidatus Micrarchaeota archaeon]MDE1849309.1 hypothetical protein [Candidatus Micrarchaeota archaeon]